MSSKNVCIFPSFSVLVTCIDRQECWVDLRSEDGRSVHSTEVFQGDSLLKSHPQCKKTDGFPAELYFDAEAVSGALDEGRLNGSGRVEPTGNAHVEDAAAAVLAVHLAFKKLLGQIIQTHVGDYHSVKVTLP